MVEEESFISSYLFGLYVDDELVLPIGRYLQSNVFARPRSILEYNISNNSIETGQMFQTHIPVYPDSTVYVQVTRLDPFDATVRARSRAG